MYRSGTTLACKVLGECGVDFGPARELLQGRGQLKELNPDGFFENTLFADLARYWFVKTGTTIERPPSRHELEGAVFDDIDFRRFARYALVETRDQRVTHLAKYAALRHFGRYGLDSYIQSRFNGVCGIKVPQLTALYRLLIARWPASRFVVVFRDPLATIKSCLQLNRPFDEQSYLEYYQDLLDDPRSGEFVYFSYDRLLAAPNESARALTSKLGLRTETDVSHLIKPALVRHSQPRSERPSEFERAYALHDAMMLNACNAPDGE